MSEQPFRIAFLIYPEMTQLDFTGPAEVLGLMPDATITLVSKTKEPVSSDIGITFVPNASIEDDTLYDMVCVPGGVGCTALMLDPAILDWLRKQDQSTQYMTSVCTGSLVLAAAGLLQGRSAGCHWAWAEHLQLFGAEPTRERVVIDGKYITAGGVTAGIDFGFRIVEQRFGRDIAEAFQLGIEYDPAPLSGGVPETARPEIVEQVTAISTERNAPRLAQVQRAAEAFQAG
ncbi:MAG: DJ-1/PfpI family protein [Pseudomonadota bacterium]